MGEIYGKSWNGHHGAEPSPGWIARIADLSDDQIRNGLSALSESEEAFFPVPTMAQFTHFCRSASMAKEKWCQWPMIGGEYVGIPKLSGWQLETYLLGRYQNVEEHRNWIKEQPFYRDGSSKFEQSVMDAYDEKLRESN